MRIILGPLAHGLVALGNRVTPGGTRGSFASEEQLLSMVDEAASNDLIEEDDRELIHSVFDFTDTFVRDVMVPRTDMVTLDSSATTREAMNLFLEKGVSRMPVVNGEVDDVEGVLYLKDLVRFGFRNESGWRDAPVRAITRRATFVPESMKAETLLQQMKREAVHVCLVVDEYGGVAGLVTLEDLIEELVGEIADEYDPRSEEVVEVEPGRYRVSARLVARRGRRPVRHRARGRGRGLGRRPAGQGAGAGSAAGCDGGGRGAGADRRRLAGPRPRTRDGLRGTRRERCLAVGQEGEIQVARGP